MYKQYMQERQLCDFLENENISFISYNIESEVCYLQDMYIVPHRRGEGLSRKLVEQLEEVALKRGCKYLITSINLTHKGNNIINQKTAKSCGFLEKTRDDEGIYYLKVL